MDNDGDQYIIHGTLVISPSAPDTVSMTCFTFHLLRNEQGMYWLMREMVMVKNSV